MKTLYVSDLDGTLLGADGKISDRSRTLLNSMMARGLSFTYATARSLESARRVTAGLKLSVDAIIYNGAMLADTQTGRLYSKLFLPESACDSLKAAARRSDLPKPFIYSFIGERETVSYCADGMNQAMARYLSSRAGDKRFVSVSMGELFIGDIFYATFMGDFADMTLLKSTLGAIACNMTLQKEPGTRAEYWLEIMPRGATKADAMLRLKRALGFERAICFGDYLNDASMFAAADEAYAVENADPALKARATGIIAGNARDGVAEFIRARFESALNL